MYVKCIYIVNMVRLYFNKLDLKEVYQNNKGIYIIYIFSVLNGIKMKYMEMCKKKCRDFIIMRERFLNLKK